MTRAKNVLTGKVLMSKKVSLKMLGIETAYKETYVLQNFGTQYRVSWINDNN